MTRLPEEIDRFESVARAKEMMQDNDIRHLPVMAGAKLFGIVSERDVDLVMAATAGVIARTEIGEICGQGAYSVLPTALVTDVAATMVEHGIGSAVVVDGDAVVGIFTVTDALRALVSAYR
jgi:acetoin utilization protein AcuB